MTPKAVKVVLFGVAVLATGFAVGSGPAHLPFAPIDGIGDVTQRIAPLFLIALFVERALEVFVTAWRAPEERIRRVARATALGQATPEEEATLVRYKSDTQRIAFVTGIALGIVVSSIGIRALALFMNPEQLAMLSGWQRPALTVVDVLITGAVIGGGADGIHKLIKVFTSFLDATTAQNEARRSTAVL
jgi:hypothetical protein